jgi:branched-chain amino acid transport system substrate-binding protein
MNLRKLALGMLAAAILAGPLVIAKAQAESIFIPVLVYRTGPYAPSGIPVANGFTDYYDMLNKRDGGVEGVKLTWDECETKYNTKLGVECYEKLKVKGSLFINPFSTGITYQLIPKAPGDKIVVLSMGYGRTSAADGSVFPWVFNFPMTYWSQASGVIKYIASQEGGLGKLKGKKIAHVYHNSAYGKEANPTLTALSKKFGFELQLLAVDHPGQEQKATWLQIRRNRPDWVFMSGWGVMNQVAVKEAASIGFPMDHFIGNWWSGSEADVIPGGKGAVGYKAANMQQPGTNFKVHQDILKHVYGGSQAKAKARNWGEVLYNRAVFNGAMALEGVRNAIKKHGKKVNGEQVRAGFEAINMTAARFKELGLEGFSHPFAVSCGNHEGPGALIIQQWDGKAWKKVSDWITPMTDVVRPLIETAAAAYAKENKITPRNCS